MSGPATSVHQRLPQPSPSGVGDGELRGAVFYGDFSCPFSALAYRRATRRAGIESVSAQWRAIEHAPDTPKSGVAVDEDSRRQFDDELLRIRSLLGDSEPADLRAPSRLLNTAGLNVLFASLPPEDRREFATSVFDGYWREGRDLSDPAEVARLGATATADGRRLAHEWQSEWESFERRMVPMMRFPDGTLSLGLDALARLQ